MLALARQLGYQVTEVPVHWHEVADGHFRPLRNLGTIVAGLRRMRRRLL